MARIRVRAGDSEIEVDSRDFYVHNDTVHSVIEGLSRCLPPCGQPMGNAPRAEGAAVRGHGELATAGLGAGGRTGSAVLAGIQDAEIAETEFADEPADGSPGGARGPDTAQIRTGISDLLDGSRFFDSPRTASDVAQRLRRDGCNAHSLAVSKTLVRLSIDKKIVRNSSKGSASTYVLRP